MATAWVEVAVRAAQEVGAQHGIDSAAPTVVAFTNNVVVRLHPHPVVAKVGRWGYSAEVLGRELEVARQLAERGAPVGPPLADVPLTMHDPTGWPVTLWHWLAAVPTTGAGPVAAAAESAAIAASLYELHRALDTLTVELPSFTWSLDLAAAALADDETMAAMAPDDLRFLRTTFAALDAEIRARPWPEHRLHGEPHDNNMVLTADGPRWIDFEAACRGPRAYDLAAVAPDIAAAYRRLAARDDRAPTTDAAPTGADAAPTKAAATNAAQPGAGPTETAAPGSALADAASTRAAAQTPAAAPHVAPTDTRPTGAANASNARPDRRGAVFDGEDDDLLALCRQVASARVAVWGWATAHLPEMRRHGEWHLGALRRASQ